MNGRTLALGTIGLMLAVLLVGIRLPQGPSAARAQAQPGAADTKVPPDLKPGARVAFDLPKHPFTGEEFTGAAVVDEVRGPWVRMTQAIKKDFQDTLRRKEVTVWVNFNLVNWYGIVP